jgi:hypothetical protein
MTSVLGHQSDDRFITAACLKLSLQPESLAVDIACAGHPAPILVPAEGTPAAVHARGDLLGVLPNIRLETAEVQLRPGDSLVAYTDGVTDQGPEARLTPVRALRRRTESGGAEELAGILEDVAHRPVGRHPDDIAIMALRFLRPGAEARALTPASATQAEAPWRVSQFVSAEPCLPAITSDRARGVLRSAPARRA